MRTTLVCRWWEKNNKPFVALLAAGAALAMATLIDASSSTQVEQFDPLVVPRTGHAATALADGRAANRPYRHFIFQRQRFACRRKYGFDGIVHPRRPEVHARFASDVGSSHRPGSDLLERYPSVLLRRRRAQYDRGIQSLG